jgi:DNA-binding NarL/FixJ family response regulator
LLESLPTLRVVAEAADGEDAIAKISQLQPDIAVLDVAIAKLDGIEVARRASALTPRTRVLALTALDDARYVRECLAAGAAGFVPKNATASDFLIAIETVAAGGRYVHPRVAQDILVSVAGIRCGREPELSERETSVLRLCAFGYSNKEIAAKLEVSVKTVETYKARGMEKIGAASRAQIVRFALAHGWFADTADLQ